MAICFFTMDRDDILGKKWYSVLWGIQVPKTI